jgi:lysophospholipase L1-like esterase
MKWSSFSQAGILLLAGLSSSLQGQQPNQPHWVATWTTAQPLMRMPPRQPPAGPARPGFAATQSISQNGFHDQTVRMVVHTSLGGTKVRIRLANAIGGNIVRVGAAHVALRRKDDEIVPESDRALTFEGKPSCDLGPGMVILSDPLDFPLPKLGDIAVSLYFPESTGAAVSNNQTHTAWISKSGDLTAQASIPDAITTGAYYWLAGVEVLAPSNNALIVALGDSITESFRSTPDTNRGWPSVLAARLQADKGTANLGVANMGIGGNRLLHDGTGASALARLDRDVFGQSGTKWLMVLEGINDIGRAGPEAVTAEDLIGADKQIIERAHTLGIKVVGCTLPPFGGAGSWREDGEAVRETLNNWIRTSGAFDGVADFEKATQDSENPKRLKAEFDPGDHLHLTDAGYQAMADSIDLAIFKGKKK